MATEHGFTLIELLLALVIAVLISLGTVFLFNASLDAREVVNQRSALLTAVNRTLAVIERDFSQLSAYRRVKDPYGAYREPIELDYEGLQLVRHGWANSRLLSYERSSLQAVTYRLATNGSELCPWLAEDEAEAGDCLIRSYRVHLDDDGSLGWSHQPLLRPVANLEWEFLLFDPDTESLEFRNEPPATDLVDGSSPKQLVAVRMTLDLGTATYQRLLRTPTVARDTLQEPAAS